MSRLLKIKACIKVKQNIAYSHHFNLIFKKIKTMEHLLRPQVFEIDPSHPKAAKRWPHFHRTFENFIGVIRPEMGADLEALKLKTLVNYAFADVFDFIAEAQTYTAAIQTFTKICVKPKNEVFAQHHLATRGQEASKTLDTYMQALKSLSKECNFQAVDADQNRNEF